MTTSATSFLSLLAIHEDLGEFFLRHQEALLAGNLSTAAALLESYEQRLRQHIRDEEDLLLPVYERAGRIPGGAVEFFTGEHRKMLEMLTRLRHDLSRIEAQPAPRDIIRLFDDAAKYKSLVEHHDQREQNILYPALDRVTGETERTALLQQCDASAPRD